MSIAERRVATKAHFGYFMAYYQMHYITNAFDDYHYDMMADAHDLIDGVITELLWVQYRGSTKTAFAKGLILYMIVNELDPFLNVAAYDDGNSEGILFDVIIELQTNKRIREDYGELYNSIRSKDEITKKRVKDFITNPKKNEDGDIVSTGVRVEAHTTQESVRGLTFGQHRPGLWVLDDFETNKTVKSVAATQTVRKFFQEMLGGRDPFRGRVLYLANYLSEYGNVQMLMDRAKVDHKLRVRVVPIHDGAVPTWPSRFVMTDAEADQLKAQGIDRISIETVQRTMWNPEEGDAPFYKEMLCQPVSDQNAMFKRKYFQYATQEQLAAAVAERGRANLYITMDTPSIKEGDVNFTGDYVGFCKNYVVSGKTPQEQPEWYLNAWRQHLGPTALIEKIISLIKDGQADPIAKLQRIAWEDTAYTRGLEMLLRKELEAQGIRVIVDWLKPAGRSKEDRIRTGLLNRYETGKVHHLFDKESGSLCADLELELLRFPNSQHDDCSDATAYQSDITKMVIADAAPQEKRVITKTSDPYQRTKQSAYEDELDDEYLEPFDDIHSPFADIEG